MLEYPQTEHRGELDELDIERTERQLRRTAAEAGENLDELIELASRSCEHETLWTGKYGWALIWCPRCETEAIVDGVQLTCGCEYREGQQ